MSGFSFAAPKPAGGGGGGGGAGFGFAAPKPAGGGGSGDSSGFSFAAPKPAGGGGSGDSSGFSFSVPKPGIGGGGGAAAAATAAGGSGAGFSFSVPKPGAAAAAAGGGSAFSGFGGAAAPEAAPAAAPAAAPSAFGTVGGGGLGGSAFGSLGGAGNNAAPSPGGFSLPKPAAAAKRPVPPQGQPQHQRAPAARPPAAWFPAIAWGPGDELQVVSSAAPEIAEEEMDENDDVAAPPPSPPTSAAISMDEPRMSAPYFQRLAQISYQVYADLLLLQQRPAGSPEALQALSSYEDCLMQCIHVATDLVDAEDAAEAAAEEARDDLLRLSMSAGILRLCRIFFFDDMGSDISGALREWFASFSAGASESGGHVNILNPESCLEDEQLWQFLQQRTEFPQAWRLDSQWSEGPDSPGWRMVYAFTTTGGLDHAWTLMLQIDMQCSISAQTKEVTNGWVELLRGGTSAGDFVYKRQALVEKAERLARNANAQEAALLRILSGDPAALGLHEPVNWVEHLVRTHMFTGTCQLTHIAVLQLFCTDAHFLRPDVCGCADWDSAVREA